MQTQSIESYISLAVLKNTIDEYYDEPRDIEYDNDYNEECIQMCINDMENNPKYFEVCLYTDTVTDIKEDVNHHQSVSFLRERIPIQLFAAIERELLNFVESLKAKYTWFDYDATSAFDNRTCLDACQTGDDCFQKGMFNWFNIAPTTVDLVPTMEAFIVENMTRIVDTIVDNKQ